MNAWPQAAKAWTALLACALLGCGEEGDLGGSPPLTIAEGCNPIAADFDCLLPFPSDVMTTPDPSLPSGRRVHIPSAAQLVRDDGGRVDLSALHPADGFSPGSQILALFPRGLDDARLTFHTQDTDTTLAPSSTTLVLDATTGQPVRHFAELDPRGEHDDRRTLALRPLERLKEGHRYVVALQGLTDRSGNALAPPEGFRRIRERKSGSHPLLGPLAQRYESDVFPVLESFGVERKTLILAWDFTVRSQPNVSGDLEAVRSLVLEWLSTETPSLQIDEVTDDPEPHLGRRIDGHVSVPLVLEVNEPNAKLHRDSAGKVVANGLTTAKFSVFVPKSVTTRAAGTPPARLMQYGHGFFGSLEEAKGPASRIANEKGFVVVATSWVGMSEEDRFKVVEKIVTDTEQSLAFTDRTHQAMANQLVVAAVAQGALCALPELEVAGQPAYDPSALYFYGNSMGHILGGTYIALSPTIERAVLGVGGANLSFITFRARPLAAFMLFVGNVFPDVVDQQKFVSLIQLSFDRVDPLTYAPRVLADTLPGSPPARRVLLQIAIGDSEVNALAGELHARALGLSSLSPAPRAVPALAEVASPFDGSALAEYDFGYDPLPGLYAVPPVDGTAAHEGLRELEAAKEQLDLFLRPDGKAVHTCSGVCDPD